MSRGFVKLLSEYKLVMIIFNIARSSCKRDVSTKNVKMIITRFAAQANAAILEEN